MQMPISRQDLRPSVFPNQREQPLLAVLPVAAVNIEAAGGATLVHPASARNEHHMAGTAGELQLLRARRLGVWRPRMRRGHAPSGARQCASRNGSGSAPRSSASGASSGRRTAPFARTMVTGQGTSSISASRRAGTRRPTTMERCSTTSCCAPGRTGRWQSSPVEPLQAAGARRGGRVLRQCDAVGMLVGNLRGQRCSGSRGK